MPYIAQDIRNELDPSLNDLIDVLREHCNSEGHLNYVISRLIGAHFQSESRYHTIARVRGVLQDVGDEFYRRIAGPYEDAAKVKNGDIEEYEAIIRRSHE